MLKRVSIEMFALLYFAAYVPYAVMVRWLSTINYPPLGRALTGLEILPATTIISAVLTVVMVWAVGWWRYANRVSLGSWQVPAPTRWTLISGIGTALLLFTVPLSFTFKGVSIPFMQLLMRGDVLIIAPLVDLLARRRVRWYSWVALILVSIGIIVTVHARGGLYLPPLAIATVVLYTVGYFARLLMMTKVGKTGDEEMIKKYFVEEKIVAFPIAVLVLALLAAASSASQGNQLSFGFVQVWASNQLGWLTILAVLLVLISVFSIAILLDKRENTFCVPIERSASVLAGVAAAVVLHMMALGPPPASTDFIGAALLIAAILVLSLGPRFGKQAPA
jgi:hypothetical protein